jgi:hypothetical protein
MNKFSTEISSVLLVCVLQVLKTGSALMLDVLACFYATTYLFKNIKTTSVVTLFRNSEIGIRV